MRFRSYPLYILILSLLYSCTPHSEGQKAHVPSPQIGKTHLEAWEKELAINFQQVKVLTLKDTLFADLNGDAKPETCFFAKKDGKSDMIIQDGKSGMSAMIGMGTPFGSGWDELNWVDYWAITEDSISFEILVEEGEIIGQKDIYLPHPSLILRREEYGGGLIRFFEGKYGWIHQAD